MAEPEPIVVAQLSSQEIDHAIVAMLDQAGCDDTGPHEVRWARKVA